MAELLGGDGSETEAVIGLLRFLVAIGAIWVASILLRFIVRLYRHH